MDQRLFLPALSSIGLGALVLGALALYSFAGRGQARVAPAARTESELDRSVEDPRVRQLTEEVARLRTAAKDSEAEAARATSQAPATAASPKQPAQLTLEESKRLDQSRFAELEARFAAEPLDQGWANTAVAALRERHRDPEFAAARLDTACRSTLCRVDMTFDPDGSFGDTGARSIVTAVPWPARGFFKLNDEAGRAVLFIAREGHALFQQRKEGEP